MNSGEFKKQHTIEYSEARTLHDTGHKVWMERYEKPCSFYIYASGNDFFSQDYEIVRAYCLLNMDERISSLERERQEIISQKEDETYHALDGEE